MRVVNLRLAGRRCRARGCDGGLKFWDLVHTVPPAVFFNKSLQLTLVISIRSGPEVTCL